MAEEVEIGNVGGEAGVASEVTLARLTATMEEMAKKKGVNPAEITKKMNKIMDESSKKIKTHRDAVEENEKATKKATKATNKFTTALAGIGGAFGSIFSGIGNFGKAILGTETSLTAFAETLPGIGGLLSPFTQYLDDSVDGFRNLSAVGASFGNSLEATRQSAAALELNFGEFQDLIINNAQVMAQFGGSVTQGAARFAQMNKNLKGTGDFRNLREMGFTVMEINEGMSDYIDLQTRMGRVQGRSTEALAAGSADYLRQIDLLAKVTGKTRKEAEASLASQATDAGIRGMLNALKDADGNLTQAGLNLQMSLGFIEEVGGAAGRSMKDLLDGYPSTDETAQFISMLGEGGPAVQEALAKIGKGADPQILLNAMTDAGGDLSRFAAMDAAERNQYIAVLRQQQPAMAEFLDGVTRLTDIGGRNLDEAAAEQDKRNKITKNLATFEDAVRKVRSTISDAFLSSGVFEKAGTLVANLAEQFTKLVETDGWKSALDAGFEIFSELMSVVSKFVDDFATFDLKTAIFGGSKEIDTRYGTQTISTEGLLGAAVFAEDGPIWSAINSLSEWISTEAGPAVGSAIGTGIKKMFTGLLPSLDTLFVGALAVIGTVIAAPFIGAAAVAAAPFLAVFAGVAGTLTAISAAFVGIAAMFGWEGIKDVVSSGWESITDTFTSISDWWSNLSFTEAFSKAWDSVTGLFTGISDWWSSIDIMGPLNDMWSTVKGWFTFGEGESFSISAVGANMWATVTGWFSMEGTDFSISALGTMAWESVKAWFSFGTDTMFSIAQLGIDAWATVLSWFNIGDGTGFSISQLATDAWDTVTSFFSFEGFEIPSISNLVSTAWDTVTSFFNFEGFEIPSISSMFQGIIDTVKGFFDFDFEMPSFKSFLPSWMGGGDDTSDNTSDNTSNTTVQSSNNVDPSVAADGANSLMNAQTAMANFANIEGLENNLNAIKNGLDTDGVRSYTRAMEDLVDTIEKLNEALAEDNQGMFGSGTGVAAADVISNTGSTGSMTNDQLNTTMNQILIVLSEMRDLDDKVERNTRNISGSNIAQGGVSAV